MVYVYVLALVIIILTLYIIYSVFHIDIEGFWTSQDGDLFYISPSGDNYKVQTASGFLNSSHKEIYPLKKSFNRNISIEFPDKTIEGRIGLIKRRIIWKDRIVWVKQGVD